MRFHLRSGAALALGVLLLAGCGHQPEPATNRVFQTSTIPALLEGVYDGDMTLAELSRHGDFVC